MTAIETQKLTKQQFDEMVAELGFTCAIKRMWELFPTTGDYTEDRRVIYEHVDHDQLMAEMIRRRAQGSNATP